MKATFDAYEQAHLRNQRKQTFFLSRCLYNLKKLRKHESLGDTILTWEWGIRNSPPLNRGIYGFMALFPRHFNTRPAKKNGEKYDIIVIKRII